MLRRLSAVNLMEPKELASQVETCSPDYKARLTLLSLQLLSDLSLVVKVSLLVPHPA